MCPPSCLSLTTCRKSFFVFPEATKRQDHSRSRDEIWRLPISLFTGLVKSSICVKKLCFPSFILLCFFYKDILNYGNGKKICPDLIYTCFYIPIIFYQYIKNQNFILYFFKTPVVKNVGGQYLARKPYVLQTNHKIRNVQMMGIVGLNGHWIIIHIN